jgi:hypothetical protein
MCANFPRRSVTEGARASISQGALTANVSTNIGARARRRLATGVTGAPAPGPLFDSGSSPGRECAKEGGHKALSSDCSAGQGGAGRPAGVADGRRVLSSVVG